MSKKPRGYFDFILAMDCETTGLALGCDDPSFNPQTQETYQAISWGFVVADANTLKPIEELYLEIKWDKKSTWAPRAEKVHGLSKEHLEKHGIISSAAVEEIGNLLLKYWGPKNTICTLGHNVATFDLWFLKRLMRSEGIELFYGNRHIDTNSVGYSTFGTYNSDDLFHEAGFSDRDPAKHNALVDAKQALETVRIVRSIFNSVL